MPLQNRVDPFGDIHAVPDRGTFTGNRGIIHDPATKTLLTKRWSTKAWIICECEFQGRRREVMGAHNNPQGGVGWTELFFLDEVTALAAGHRPCFYCRRAAATDFVARIGQAFGMADPKAPELDARLHAERLASGSSVKDISSREFDDLPDGVMLFQDERSFAKRNGELRAWTFWGWGDAWDFYELAEYDVWLITPPTTVAALKAGYQPVWHPSIGP
jgi:hypothetical protein